MSTIIDISDIKEDLKQINHMATRAEVGIRAISVMYEDHSPDKNSYEFVFGHKDNVHFKLFSVHQQYVNYLRQIQVSELLLRETARNHVAGVWNWHLEKAEMEIAAIFDGIIFQLTSFFDYISHFIHYVCKRDKNATSDWNSLAKAVRGKGNEFSDLAISEVIKNVDKKFVDKLYDYRSRLIHKRRDKHEIISLDQLKINDYKIKIFASTTSISYFKTLRHLHPDAKISLTYLASWIIKESFMMLEQLLFALKDHIQGTSHFEQNLMAPKRNYIFVNLDEQNRPKPTSDAIWSEYLLMK